MASKLASTCGPCSYRKIEHAASMWCLDCKEGLCDDCKEIHSALKVLRSHDLIPYGDVHKLPEIAQNIRETCFEHNRPLEVYCSDHRQGCCIKCTTTDHKSCTHVSPMEEMTKTAKSSVALINVQERLNALISKLEMIIENKKDSVKDIDDQTKNIMKDVQDMQTRVVAKLKSLVEKVKTDADEIQKGYETNTADVIKTLTNNLEAAREIQVCIKQIMDNGSNLQLFLCLNELETLVHSEETKLSVALDAGELLNTELHFKYDDELNRIETIKCIGELTTEKKPFEIPTGSYGQCAKTTKSKHNINEITLEKKYTITLPTGSLNVTNCLVLPICCMLFVDFSDSKRLILYDGNRIFLRDILMEANPFDATVISDTVIAITLPKAEKVVFLEFTLDGDNISKEMKTVGQCYGINYSERRLAVAVKGHGIQIFTDDGTKLRTIPFACTVLTFVQSNIAFIEKGDKVVRCCDLQGKQLWEWEIPKEKFYDYPSINEDGCGCLYIAECNSDNVYIVSKDGASWKQILQRSDGLYNVNGIFVNKRKQELLVCTKRDKEAVLYKIEEQ